MSINIRLEKLDKASKEFLEKYHNVPQASTFAVGPISDDGMDHTFDEISTFQGLGGEMAVGDQDAFSAFMRIAEKQNLSANQMPKGYELPGKEEIIEEVSLPAYEPIVPVSCPQAPEMGC